MFLNKKLLIKSLRVVRPQTGQGKKDMQGYVGQGILRLLYFDSYWSCNLFQTGLKLILKCERDELSLCVYKCVV